MSTRKEEALDVELTNEELEYLRDPKFTGLLVLYEAFNKQLNLLNKNHQTIQSKMKVIPQDVIPSKIDELMNSSQMSLHKTQRNIQDLTEYKIQLIKFIKSVLKANAPLDINKLHSMQLEPLVKFFDQLTAQIEKLENSIINTAKLLKQLEEDTETDADEINSYRETLSDIQTKLLNMQLIQSNLYHLTVNYFESLSENEKNNLKSSSTVFTEELSRNLIQQARKQFDAQRELMTAKQMLPDNQNITYHVEKIIKNYSEHTNILLKLNTLLKKCIDENAKPELTDEERQQLSSTQKLNTFVVKYEDANATYSKLLENFINHLNLMKNKFGEFSTRNVIANKQSLQYLIQLDKSLSECNKILSFIKACLNLDIKQLNSTISHLSKDMVDVDKSKKLLIEQLDKIENHKFEQQLNGLKPLPQALLDEKIFNKQLEELNNKYRFLQEYKKIAEEYYQVAVLEAKQLHLRAHSSSSVVTTTVPQNKPPRKSNFS